MVSGARILRHEGGPVSCSRHTYLGFGRFGPCEREARFVLVLPSWPSGGERRQFACRPCTKSYAEAAGLAMPGEATLFEPGEGARSVRDVLDRIDCGRARA